eukprot:753088-Hanusia_phi.AAC.8
MSDLSAPDLIINLSDRQRALPARACRAPVQCPTDVPTDGSPVDPGPARRGGLRNLNRRS